MLTVLSVPHRLSLPRSGPEDGAVCLAGVPIGQNPRISTAMSTGKAMFPSLALSRHASSKEIDVTDKGPDENIHAAAIVSQACDDRPLVGVAYNALYKRCRDRCAGFREGESLEVCDDVQWRRNSDNGQAAAHRGAKVFFA